jgi:hypothetical protein
MTSAPGTLIISARLPAHAYAPETEILGQQ